MKRSNQQIIKNHGTHGITRKVLFVSVQFRGQLFLSEKLFKSGLQRTTGEKKSLLVLCHVFLSGLCVQSSRLTRQPQPQGRPVTG
jgi:hypothetical protein